MAKIRHITNPDPLTDYEKNLNNRLHPQANT